MILEYLTGGDGNVFEYSDMEFELMAGDFGVSVTEIRDVVDYCIKLELLFIKNGFVCSERLDERLAPVYKKRNKAKDISNKQKRSNGKFVTDIAVESVVTVTETPQSKVNKSKVNKSKVFIAPTLEDVKKYCLERRNNVNPQKWMDHYISNGWKVGRNPMKDWMAAVRKWEGSEYNNIGSRTQTPAKNLGELGL
jgi:hypothetical protein